LDYTPPPGSSSTYGGGGWIDKFRRGRGRGLHDSDLTPPTAPLTYPE